MLRRIQTRLLLTPADIPPTQDDLRVVGVLNPGAAAVGVDGEVVMLVRVVEQPLVQREGFASSPYWNGQGIAVTWLKNSEWNLIDPRTATRFADGKGLLRFISHLRVVRLTDGLTVAKVEDTALRPSNIYEEYGLEDPRITPIDDGYAITYVGVSRHGVSTCLATSRDLTTFERHGVIFCPENKDVMLFPERIGGRYVALHRPTMTFRLAHPEMWLAWSPDMIHWGGHVQLLGAESPWAGERIGGGCPPIRTDRGWLVIYHGVHREPGQVAGTYRGAAMLLDLDDPTTIIAHSNGPIMQPEADFELEGFLPDVVFPTGIVRRGDSLLVYYGAADDKIGVTELSLNEMLDAMTKV